MPTADTVFTNGDILTMNDTTRTAEALAVTDGRITAVGSEVEVRPTQGPGTRRIDLCGRTLLPGFIDGHSHFINAVRMASWANVSIPPVGPVRRIADLIAELRAAQARLGLKPGEWLVAYGYENTGLAEGRELTRADLDPYFPDNPVLLTSR